MRVVLRHRVSRGQPNALRPRIRLQVGRADFEVAALKENLNALITDLKKAKPASAKGVFLMKLTVSSTMGPGVAIDRASIDV